MDVAKGPIGPEAEYNVTFSEGNLRIELSYKGEGGKAGMFVEGDAAYLVDKITDAIPGEWDDAVIDGMVEKLLSKKTS